MSQICPYHHEVGRIVFIMQGYWWPSVVQVLHLIQMSFSVLLHWVYEMCVQNKMNAPGKQYPKHGAAC